jgi:serine 3-dehydrogenase
LSALQGKVVVITGASAGIGEAIARDLASLGARLVLNARREGQLVSLAEELGTEVEIVGGDIADADVAQRLLDATLARFGRVDVLINNAGIFRNGPLDTVDLGELEKMIALNFTAVVRNSYLFARVMKQQGAGHIVNISSISANLNTPGCGVYSGTKRALEGFSECLRIELAGTGVRVGIVSPGATATEVFDHIPAASRPSANLQVRKLDAADIADAVRYVLERPAHANIPHLRLYSAEQRH